MHARLGREEDAIKRQEAVVNGSEIEGAANAAERKCDVPFRIYGEVYVGAEIPAIAEVAHCAAFKLS